MGKWQRAYLDLVSEVKETRDELERKFRETGNPYHLGAWHALHAVGGTADEIKPGAR